MYNPKLNKSGKPQEFKGVYFYPFLLKDEEYYEFIISMLSFNKNTTTDVNIVKMSYLKYLLICVQYSFADINIGEKLQEILSFITKTNVIILYKRAEDDDEYFSKTSFSIKFDDIELDEWKFEKIREIILEQNGVSIKYLDEYDKTLEESLRFVYRNSNMANHEEQIFAYCIYMKMSIQEVENTVTFYQFGKIMDRIRLMVNFETMKPLEVSGQISFKYGKTIDDWLSHIPKRGRYDDILVKQESFVENNDIFKVSGQK